MLKTIRWCFLGLSMAFAQAHAVPTLITDVGTGKLLGADRVDVGGTLYDVRFVDGTCFTLYSECDAVADFPFTGGAVNLASQALLDQVLIGAFDADPALTSGCTDPFQCLILTPYNPFAPGAVASG